MQDYLRSVWAMLTPCKEDTVPLLASNRDLEACGGAPDAGSIVVVCDVPAAPSPFAATATPTSSA